MKSGRKTIVVGSAHADEIRYCSLDGYHNSYSDGYLDLEGVGHNHYMNGTIIEWYATSSLKLESR